jgi:hypothetical protein
VVDCWLTLMVIQFLIVTFAVLSARKQMCARDKGKGAGDSLGRSVRTAGGNRAVITNLHGVFRVTFHLKASNRSTVAVRPKETGSFWQITCKCEFPLSELGG